MKTVKKAKVIKRVKDKQALELVKKGWAYCPKAEWKELRKAEENKEKK
jgi:hypothetical protein